MHDDILLYACYTLIIILFVNKRTPSANQHATNDQTSHGTDTCYDRPKTHDLLLSTNARPLLETTHRFTTNNYLRTNTQQQITPQIMVTRG